jgi:aminoglycoside/choline kinase family phosphotransferase
VCVCERERERERERENLKAWENSRSAILQEVDAHYHIAVNRNFIIKNIIINSG